MRHTKLFFFTPALGTGGLERVLSVLSNLFADNYDYIEYIMWYDIPVFYDINHLVKIVSVEKECGSKHFFKKILWLRKHVFSMKPHCSYDHYLYF